jgi:DNA adenine methylase
MKSLLNDVNPHLINFYRWLKSGLKIEIEMKNASRLFYRHRTRFNKLLATNNEGGQEAASLFYYLNRTGYNGLCRFNRKGEFNVPFGSHRKINYVDDFSDFTSVFADWEFINSDFEEIPLESEDFVYADPPYDVDFTSYSKGGFSWDDQKRAAEWLAKHKGPVILVNQDTKRISDCYKSLGYEIQHLPAPRMINCTGDRSPAREVLAFRNL